MWQIWKNGSSLVLRSSAANAMLTSNRSVMNGSDVFGDGDDESGGYIAYNERLETYLVPVVFGIIFLVGVVGNACLIFILCRHKAMRSVPNTFIFNLALGDLLVLLCAVPFTSTVFTLESWPYGLFVCKASEFAKVLNDLFAQFKSSFRSIGCWTFRSLCFDLKRLDWAIHFHPTLKSASLCETEKKISAFRC